MNQRTIQAVCRSQGETLSALEWELPSGLVFHISYLVSLTASIIFNSTYLSLLLCCCFFANISKVRDNGLKTVRLTTFLTSLNFEYNTTLNGFQWFNRNPIWNTVNTTVCKKKNSPQIYHGVAGRHWTGSCNYIYCLCLLHNFGNGHRSSHSMW